MNQTAQAPMKDAPLPLPEPEGLDYEDFRIHDRRAIIGVMREIIQKRSLVTLSFGGEFIITSLMDVDPVSGALFFDAAQSEAQNLRITGADRLHFVTLIDNIKTQFQTDPATSTNLKGWPALRTAIPASLLRLQRRNHFRIQAPRAEPLVCAIPMPGGAVARFVIGDLSVSGIAVLAGPDFDIFQPGAIFENCRIELPEHGEITTSIEIRNLVPAGGNGADGARFRFGCRFLNLAGTVESLLQRYINHLERSRRALL